MKAEVAQQRSLLELAELDAELARIAHRAGHLPEQQERERIQADQVAAADRLAALELALEDLDAQAGRLESEIDAVRQREDRDRALLDSSQTNVKQVADLQHELETLQKRQSSLEDSLLELMEQREQLQTQADAEAAVVEGLAADLARVQEAVDTALAEIETTRAQRATSRDELVATIGDELLALYERQRASAGVGAGPLRGGQCGACRIEIDRGELARISAAEPDEVLRCPECNAILLRVKDFG
ncbi:C4-type zinc ribbon domain-containing protein [[Mycobacterium] kokjensenii]|uniref:C4-type zinc ribbon domain-containing protein n=1 Tax=[Mycobacterium] kokjensenii TaxID=3064287 RepID=A0ABM9LCL1_9MYCO|nr:C4-type zinc ribbon domain-containing protein [Mycolicibacter sp. MU0083]CAJ1496742.1 C4-type zinc ribbon domain-containing protein [Mycolicibacter sp. MU0083]